jgi:hypothetical protein
LLIVEVEEVGRVVYSVRGLPSANHQSSIINHQSSIINHPALNPSWFKISVDQRSRIFGSYHGTVPAPLTCFGLFGFSPEGDTRTAGVRKPPELGAHPTPQKAQRATYELSGEW